MENFNPRYERHYSLKDFGLENQLKLTKAKVLVIGAGGLGCAALQYLAASGVGTIGIADHDLISISNLQRQVLYANEDIGKSKVEVAGLKLKLQNPEVTIESFKMIVQNTNALELIADYDVIIDCTDNFAARYLINDACFLLKKSLIFGAVYQYEGQIAVFNVADKDGNKTNYRNLFPTSPNPNEVSDCNEAGVLGVLPGIIGIMQATETIKLLTGIGDVLINKILTYNILNYESLVIEITSNTSVNNYIPKDEETFKNTNYNWICENIQIDIEELDATSFYQKNTLPDTLVIDVREAEELPKVDFENINIPLSTFDDLVPEINQNNIILFCQSGKRSLKAGQLLVEKYKGSKKISHLKGGIIEL